MGFLEERDLTEVPTIPEFYKGKTLFLTGGTGFIGKVLIEKLLYSCSELDRIYLLMRPKKNDKPEDRLAKLYASADFTNVQSNHEGDYKPSWIGLNVIRRDKNVLPLTIKYSRCYDRLRREKPDVFTSKVFVVAGDVMEPGLGLSQEDRTLLVNRVNIIFHIAASVRFDDTLKYAVQMNLKGTWETIELAKEVRDLYAFVHVSTCYSNTNRDPIEEVLYPPLADWRETVAICETYDDHALKILTPKYLGEIPNTYTFTKQLAEHVVSESRGQLPIVIVRPSIVISSMEEPVPGWVENFNGPVGLMVACGKGIMRSFHSKPKVVCDFIPVDACARNIAAAAWIRGTKKLEPTDDIPIYNCCAGKLNSIEMADLIEMSKNVAKKSPLDGMLWNIGGKITVNEKLHYIKVLLQHLLPALFVDTLLWIFGKKPMLTKIQRRIYVADLALRYFTTQQWTFDNKNFVALRSVLKDGDRSSFTYVLEDVDIQEYFLKACFGARRYLLKENDEDIPTAKAHLKRMVILDKLTQIVFYGAILYWAINRFGPLLGFHF